MEDIKTISQQLEMIVSEICSNYCKYPLMPVPEGKTEEWLMEDGSPCENCPLTRYV